MKEGCAVNQDKHKIFIEVRVDTAEINDAQKKVERLIESLKIANSLMEELTTKGGIND